MGASDLQESKDRITQKPTVSCLI